MVLTSFVIYLTNYTGEKPENEARMAFKKGIKTRSLKTNYFISEIWFTINYRGDSIIFMMMKEYY